MQTSFKLAIALVLIPFSFLWNQVNHQKLSLNFYSEELSLVYHPDIQQYFSGKLEEQTIVNYYEILEETEYESLVNSLKQEQQRLKLNDWLVYELTQTAVNKIFKDNSQKGRTLAIWFFLSKLGYDTRLAFYRQEAYIYVRSLDDIYETPIIEDQGKRFIGLTEMQNQRTTK